MKRLISIGLILALLMMGILPISVSSQPTTTKYAVIMAYDGSRSCKIWASTCARQLDRVLKDNGFSPKNIRIDTRATQGNLIEAIDWLKGVEDSHSEVVVAFFGHGSATAIGLRLRSVLHSEVRDLLSCLESQKQLVIIDTCGSAGAILEGRDGVTLSAPNRIVLTSTEHELESSVFTGHLTDWTWAVLVWSLKEGKADFNGDGRVSIQEAGSVKGGISDGYGQEFFL